MDFNYIALSKSEWTLLKRINNGKIRFIDKSNVDFLRLHQLDLITFRASVSPNRVVSVRLTSTGTNYLMFKRAEQKRLFKNSVMWPIIVAFITTVLTTDIWPHVKSVLIEFLQSMKW